MSTANIPKNAIAEWETVRDDWIEHLHCLVASLEMWAKDSGWSSRRIEKEMQDSQIGRYPVPALLLQEGTARIMLEPITRFAPGVEGVVDLYLMPAYDDLASLYVQDGVWKLHYPFAGTPRGATIRDAEVKPLSRETFQEVLREIARNGA